MLEALFVAGIGLVGSVVTNAYYYGKLTQKVSGSEKRLDKVEAKVDVLGTRVATLEGRVQGD
jgi:hypothetical protein